MPVQVDLDMGAHKPFGSTRAIACKAAFAEMVTEHRRWHRMPTRPSETGILSWPKPGRQVEARALMYGRSMRCFRATASRHRADLRLSWLVRLVSSTCPRRHGGVIDIAVRLAVLNHGISIRPREDLLPDNR